MAIIKRGVRLKYRFDKMVIGDVIEGKKHIIFCAINWAKRNNPVMKFASHKIGDDTYKITRVA